MSNVDEIRKQPCKRPRVWLGLGRRFPLVIPECAGVCSRVPKSAWRTDSSPPLTPPSNPTDSQPVGGCASACPCLSALGCLRGLLWCSFRSRSPKELVFIFRTNVRREPAFPCRPFFCSFLLIARLRFHLKAHGVSIARLSHEGKPDLFLRRRGIITVSCSAGVQPALRSLCSLGSPRLRLATTRCSPTRHPSIHIHRPCCLGQARVRGPSTTRPRPDRPASRGQPCGTKCCRTSDSTDAPRRIPPRRCPTRTPSGILLRNASARPTFGMSHRTHRTHRTPIHAHALQPPRGCRRHCPPSSVWRHPTPMPRLPHLTTTPRLRLSLDTTTGTSRASLAAWPCGSTSQPKNHTVPDPREP